MRARSRDISNCSTGSARLVNNWFNCPLLPSYLFVYFYQVTYISFFWRGSTSTQINTNLTKKINPSNWSEMDQKSKIQESWARRALALIATACSLAGTEVKGWLPGFFRSFWLVERRQPFPRLSQSGRGTSDQQREPFGAAKVRSRFFSAACALWPTIQPVRSVLLRKLIKSKKNIFWNWKKWVATEILKL